MKVKISKLRADAVIPQYAKEGDAGMDLTAVAVEDAGLGVVTYRTGLAVEIPTGFVGLLFPRSSVYKTGLTMCNCVGVIDSGYRGEIMVKFFGSADNFAAYQERDRVAQLVVMPVPHVELEEVFELSASDRGTGGFGSTGRAVL